VGNFLTDSVDDVINNLNRRRIQDDMRAGEFTFCNDQCPQLNTLLSGGTNFWDIIPIRDLDDKLQHETMNVGFSYDLSCNLQCPSCRNQLIVWRPDDINDVNGQRIRQIHVKVKDLVKRLVLEHPLVNLNITGSGDAFASPLYWDYLVELASEPVPPNLRITLKTNGVMMTEENWNAIKPLWPIISYIEVSVDAATEDTYKIVRKNGNFKKLQKNLEVLDKLIFNKCFPNLTNWQTNFIVQRDNYFELKPFVEWQLQFDSKPLIWTNLIAQWYHMDDVSFNKMAIWKDGHVSRDEFLKILQDPIFKHPQIKLGNLNSFLS
jgi:MoaA/NifB/PqqE/SkfB family radical SAM enzyme